MRRRQSNPEYLRAAYLRALEVVDALDSVHADNKSPTLEDRIAYADARRSLQAFADYFHTELSIVARRGGHGHRVRGAAADAVAGRQPRGGRPGIDFDGDTQSRSTGGPE
ncbi:hypothetical protein [Luteimonas terrae]|uniref:Uncharacterized protein n=1 Tax=Luteimonas terrae TaxID=1530191 RepID=A0A4R5UD30_9GAMM|nr:hypothetical protein [Luteimonas terrae]TDK33184.1 hypothetical protein E2F49_03850 [Luteimonas terrae]